MSAVLSIRRRGIQGQSLGERSNNQCKVVMGAVNPQTCGRFAGVQKLGFKHFPGNSHVIHQGRAATQFGHAGISKKRVAV